MKRKYYADLMGTQEYVFDLPYWIEESRDQQKPIEIELQKRAVGGDMWCKIDSEFITSGEGYCGKNECHNYAPRNGKSGCCRHLVNTFTCTGKIYIVTPDGKVTRKGV